MSDETYEGWANRETWAFWLHVTNDQGWYESVRDYAADYLNTDGDAQGEGDDPALTYSLGEAVVEYVKDTLDEIEWEAHGERALALRGMRDEIGSWWRIDYSEIGAAARELASDQ